MPHPDAGDTPSVDAAARGRAMLVGLGLDDGAGHARYTLGRHFRLVGGSETVHEAMRGHALRLVEEIERRGYRLESLAREDVPAVRRLIEAHFTADPAPPAR